MADTIIRLDPEEDGPSYSMARATAQDERLTWQAWGLLSYLHSLPRDWGVSPADLIKRRKGGRDRMYGMLRELRGAGYMRLVEHRDAETGQIERYEYLVRMRPLPDSPHTDSPHTANQHTTDRDSGRQSSKSSKPPIRPPEGATPADQMRRIFEEWKSATGRNGTTGYDEKRKRAIRGRLGEGFTPDQLVAAVQAIPLSDFHNGRHPKTKGADAAQLRRLTELTLHLRDATHVEAMLALVDDAPAGRMPESREPRIGYVATDEELIASANLEGNDCG